MMTFVHYFSFLVGDFVPENDRVWEFFLIFLNLIDTNLSRSYNEELIHSLKYQIKLHNKITI